MELWKSKELYSDWTKSK